MSQSPCACSFFLAGYFFFFDWVTKPFSGVSLANFKNETKQATYVYKVTKKRDNIFNFEIAMDLDT